MQFEYEEDRNFFAKLLSEGSLQKLETQYADMFDFRPPAIKRGEFNKIQKKVIAQLVEKYDGVCQLQLHPDCSKEKIWHPDHIIPLSSNDLNKQIRNMGHSSGKKVIAQSFGSNHESNFTLACKRCNAFKKNHFMLPKTFK